MKNLILLFLLVSCKFDNQVKEQETLSWEMEALDGRPAALIVGDSISMGYNNTIKAQFPNLQIIHNTGNAGTTRNGVVHIREWVGHSRSWEFCTINHGLHDIHIGHALSAQEYLENLKVEIAKLKSNCKTIIFSTTTRVPENAIGRSNEKVVEFNKAAASLMNKLNVPVCDLYFVSLTIPHLHKKPETKANIHYVPAGYVVLGEALAKCIKSTSP
jgi:hypothetical protein